MVANGGINPGATTFVNWSTTSPAAWQEHGGPFGYTLPPPGVTWDGDESVPTRSSYDALVLDACESFSPFPVTHDATIEESGNEIGAFHGVDNSTLDHTGYCNFSYKARATGENGKVSDFLFSRKGQCHLLWSQLVALTLAADPQGSRAQGFRGSGFRKFKGVRVRELLNL